MSDRLHRMCKRKQVQLRKVAEVGVYFPETSNILAFIRDGIPAMLVEADPKCVEKIEHYFAAYPQVQIFPYAVWDDSGFVTLYRTNASTFVGELTAAPALVNDAYARVEEDSFQAEARRFSEIDDGSIDLLSIDIEGAEWYVLKHLRSRPVVIALETHAGEYNNPFMPQIREWMRANGYERWFVDNTDTVYARRGAIDFSTGERLRHGLGNKLTLLRHKLLAGKRTIKKSLLGTRRRH